MMNRDSWNCFKIVSPKASCRWLGRGGKGVLDLLEIVSLPKEAIYVLRASYAPWPGYHYPKAKAF
jgi:hypothetical protein